MPHPVTSRGPGQPPLDMRSLRRKGGEVVQEECIEVNAAYLSDSLRAMYNAGYCWFWHC